jgi:hypothetical protein
MMCQPALALFFVRLLREGQNARLARADRGLDGLNLVDVDDGLVFVAADPVHGAFA